MDVACPACGEQNPQRAKFCLECGSPITAAPSRESRRTVTVVFADMVGFTTLGERLDQESLRRVMDRFYAEMRQAIEDEQGTLAKFIGDAVLAVWGTPEVREDDAIRAVRAADAMRRSLAGLNEDLAARWGVRVGMRTGVNTGEVVVDPARPADLLVGDTLNVAARLEQAAADGEVLVGPGTQRLVRDLTMLEPVEPLALKGKSRPMPAWRVVDSTQPDRRAAPRLEAPLVGRAEELGRLRASFDEVVSSRACRLVSVIASPGLGKTRLVAELARSVGHEATVLEGRCEVSGEGITFQPVAEVVRSAASIDEDDGADAALAKIGALLPADDPDRERVTDRAAALLGLAPATSTEETFWAVRRLLEALARERPVVLIHEDIHWGQPTFLDLLEHLAEWVRDVPLLIVALARPELRETRPALAERGGPVADALALEPLDGEASRALVDGLLAGAQIPPALAERVLETTEGNPLFLGEMLRMLADDGVLRREGESWTASDVAVPPTIQALLAARIERLGDDERGVVERASVIGHQFYRGAVAELTPPPGQPSIDGALVTLQRKELVRPEDALWLDERVFRFHHVLIRDAAYRSLLKEARADMHERFADWLEAKAGAVAAEQDEVVAFHLEQAHRYRLELGPLDERGRALASRAAARLHSAGRLALAREDLPAAINLLSRALAPILREQRLEVLVDLAEALLSAGDTVRAEEVVEELGLGADEADDERLGAWATAFAGQLDSLTGAGHVRETAEAAAEAAEVLARHEDHAGEAKAHQVVAQAEALLGNVAAAEAALDSALVAARAANDRRRVTAVLSGSPRAALWGPAPIVRASGRCLDVVRILRMTPGTKHVEAAALRCQAVLEAMRDRPDAARSIIAGCRETFEELGLTLELHETAVHAGIVELLAGDPAAAEARLREARDGFLALHLDGGAAQAAALLAQALLAQGRDGEALEATRFAEERGGEDLKTTIAWLGARAQALARAGSVAEALPLAEQAVALSEPTDALADKADAQMALAAVRAAAGDAAGAREAASLALSLYDQKDHVVGAGRAAALVGDASAPADAGAAGAEDDAPASPWLRRYLEAVKARDWDALRAMYADDFSLADHRGMDWDSESFRGGDGMVAQTRSLADVDPGFEVAGHVLRAEPEVEAALLSWRGAGWEITLVRIDRRRGDVAVHGEVFDPADEDALARCFDAMVRERELEQSAIGRAHLEYLRAFNERDWDAFRAVFHPDYVNVEHRLTGGWDVDDADGLVEANRSWTVLAPDAALVPSAVRAQAQNVLACEIMGAGSVNGAAVELAVAVVIEFRDGKVVRTDAFDPGDTDAILACFEERRIEQELQTTTIGRLSLEYLRALNERDWDAFREVFHHDYEHVETDALASWNVRSAQELERAMRDWAAMAADARAVATRIYAHSEHVLACVFTGRGSVDGAKFELPQALVSVERNGRIARTEIVALDDEEAILAVYRRLSATTAHEVVRQLEQTAIGRLHLELKRAYNERDWDAYRATHAPGFVQIDHRNLGWEVKSPDDGVELARSWIAMGDDGRLQHARLLAQTEHVLAVEMVGIATVDGIAMEMPFGLVVEERGGGATRAELFEPDDDAAMLACFERMSGGESDEAEVLDPDDDTALLARYDALQGEVELGRTAVGRCHLAYMRAINARDWDALASVYSSDYTHVDHRQVGGWDARTGADIVAIMQAWAQMTADGRLVLLRIHAHSEHLLALSASGRGTVDGVAFELPQGMVLHERGGQLVRGETFDEGDVEGMLARFEELGGGSDSGERPGSLRVYDAWVRASNAREWDVVRDLYTPDFVLIDGRGLGWEEVRGGEGIVALTRSFTDAAPSGRARVGRVLEASEDAVALVLVLEAEFEQGGHSEIVLGHVTRVSDGRFRLIEMFEPDDDALLARYAEVAAEAERERRLEATAVGRSTLAYLRAFNARDWDAFGALYADDYVHADHRNLDAWDAETGEQVAAAMRQWGEMAPGGRLVTAEVIAMDEHVLAAIMIGSGTANGVEFEVPHGLVMRERDGQWVHGEIFVPSDRDAMLSCFERLRVDGVDQPEPNWVALHEAQVRELPRLYERDSVTAAVLAMYAPDVRIVDHRAVSPMGELDRDGLHAQFRSIAEQVTEARVAVEILEIDGPRRMIRVSLRGVAEAQRIPLDYHFCLISKIRADGRIVSGRMFDDEAEARRMWAGGQPEFDTPATRGLERYLDAVRRHDRAGLAECLAAGFRLVDRRPVGWGELDRESMLDTVLSLADVAPAFGVASRVVAATDDAVAHISTYSGMLGEGGEAEMVLAAIRVGRDQTTYFELFDPSAEQVMRARFDELTAPGLRPVHPLARVNTERLVHLFNERRWDDVRALAADDLVVRDTRAISGPAFRGPDGLAEVWRGIVDMNADVRMSAEMLAGELLPNGLLISAALTTHRAEGETPFEVTTGTVRASRDGLLTHTDVVEEDRDAVLARYDELRAELLASAEPDWEAMHAAHIPKFGALWDPDTADRAIEELYSPELRFFDRRTISPMGNMNREALRTQIRSVANNMTDPDVSLEIVEFDGPWRLGHAHFRAMTKIESIPLDFHGWYVVRLDSAGRMTESYMYDDEALAREKWASARPSSGSDAPPAERTPR